MPEEKKDTQENTNQNQPLREDGEMTFNEMFDEYATKPVRKADGQQVNQPTVSNADGQNANDQTQLNQPGDPGASKEEGKEGAEPTVYELNGEDFRVKWGDDEFTREDLQQAIADHRNKETWLQNLTNDSKMLAWIRKQSPEMQDRFKAFAIAHTLGKEKLPEDFKDTPFEFEVKLKDEYGEEITGKFNLEPGSKEYEQLQKRFYEKFKQEHQPAFLKLQQYEETAEQHEQERQTYEETATANYIKDFIRQNKIDFPLEGNVLDNLKTAVSDKTSPYKTSAMRLLTAAQAAQQTGMTLEAAYSELYGKVDASKAAAKQKTEQAKGKQQEAAGGQPGGTPAKPDWATQTFQDEKADRMQKLYSGELG